MDTTGPALLTIEEHLAGLESASETLLRHAGQTWLGARVPTCPDWDVLDLVAHQGMVHRWAIAAIRQDRAGMGNASLHETEGRTSADPLAWLRQGMTALSDTLRAAPDDLEAVVFLAEAPPAKAFWARRQCHETTMHAVDALAAAAGRLPTAADVWFGPDLALDGIDELLLGFWQRSRSELRSTIPYAVHVRPDDAPVAWLVTTGEQPPRCHRLGAGERPEVDAVLAGSAVDLHLALWNRGGTVDDPDGVLEQWSTAGRITWG